ncbi:hypothetical protein ACFL35_02555 [Candidatus Riflebacteria bacterium]
MNNSIDSNDISIGKENLPPVDSLACPIGFKEKQGQIFHTRNCPRAKDTF